METDVPTSSTNETQMEPVTQLFLFGDLSEVCCGQLAVMCNLTQIPIYQK